MTVLEKLLQRRLVVVTGKGGVGKSLLTAVLGRTLAARGRRTLLLEVDPRENLHQLCGIPPSGGEVVEVSPRLYLQNLKSRDVVDWVVERQVRMGPVVKRILQSPVYHRFVGGAPGLTEMAILGHALRLVRGERKDMPRLDTIVLDAPATGHGLYLLTAARLFADAIGEGPFAELAREVAEWVDDPEQVGLLLVTLAEEMPVQEAIELRGALRDKLDREPELLVINGLYPPLPDGAAQASDDPLDDLWRHRREVNEHELARLAEHWSGPRIELPLMPTERETELVASLGRRFEKRLAELEEEDA